MGMFGITSLHSAEPYDDAEAYAVYSVVIRTASPSESTWLIRRETLPYSLPQEPTTYSPLPLQSGEHFTGAMQNYGEVNAKSWLLENRFNLSKPFKLLSTEELLKVYQSKFHTGVLPGGYVVDLSAVGFNADKTEAAIYMSTRVGHQIVVGRARCTS